MLKVSVEVVGTGVPLSIGHQHPQEAQVCWERKHSPWSGRVPIPIKPRKETEWHMGSELLRFCRPIIHLSGDNGTDFYRDNRKKESTDHESPDRFKSWLCHFLSICPLCLTFLMDEMGIITILYRVVIKKSRN